MDYGGNELALFQRTVNWKRYLGSRTRPFVNGNVLEVGAGFGANVPYFHRLDLERWVSLEPDPRLCEEYRRRQAEGIIPERCALIEGTLAALRADESFDSIVYIDVLEHIEDDKAELHLALKRLNVGGHLVILCPAHNVLMSPFDREIGHFRRYDKRMYRELSDHEPIKLEYLDSVGLAASMANKLLLRQAYPSEKQIAFWDKVIVRLSLLVDPMISRTAGKSIMGVWRR